MNTFTPLSERMGLAPLAVISWSTPDLKRHAFVAIACPEEEGGYSMSAAHYPGVISQGDTLDEAKANIAEAFLGMVEARKKRGEELPYDPADPSVPANCIRVWIEING